MVENVPRPIQFAVKCLAILPDATVESSPKSVAGGSAWAIQLNLTASHVSEFVPKVSSWVALVENTYPAGQIRIFPAREGGIVHTFPHQDRNIESSRTDLNWRAGKPCLDSPSQRLGRIAGGPEPKTDMEQRLLWHVRRCLAWLRLAAVDQLMVADEPFEVPQCPKELLDGKFTVVHDEGNDAWPNWEGRVREYGEVSWGALTGFEKRIVAEEFLDASGTSIRTCRRNYGACESRWFGFWWLWPSPVVILPWHAPGTWAELRQVGKRLDVDVDEFISWMACRAGGKEAIIVLVGYPIPRFWHGPPVEVHWQAICPPNIPKKIKPMRADVPKGLKPMKGFLANKLARRERLRRDIFSGEKKLIYVNTENWHPDRLQARGRVSDELRERSVAVLGAGALGSAIAELLARAGVSKIFIVDHDDLEIGNLVRHTLTGSELGHNKATAVAARLRKAAPMARISSSPTCLPAGEELQKILAPFDVILDCTGEDDVLRRLGAGWWSIPRLFLSASLGFSASRLFLFEAYACCFPFDEFKTAVDPWLERERALWADSGDTLEGAGCWSPLFPARYDDILLAAITAVKHLERAITISTNSNLSVYEQTEELVGFRPVAVEMDTSSSAI